MTKLRFAVAGLGKMGLSHFAIVNTHPNAELVAVCDTANYILRPIARYTGIATYTDYEAMLETEILDAIIIATPSSLHANMVELALKHNLHIFCEKPFCLDVSEGQRLVNEAKQRNLVTQVGYHHRFIATFEEARTVVAAGLLGKVSHARVECYGPVVLKKTSKTWRTRKSDGGGCLYDYASHGIDLLNFLFGRPADVTGSFLGRIYSQDVDDEVYSTLVYDDGKTAYVSANWSDDSHRKMSTQVSIWGDNGKLVAGRQELSLYLRSKLDSNQKYGTGWSKMFTTSLSTPVWFYLRGEEYSQQVDHFVTCILNRSMQNRSDFQSACATDIVSANIRIDATSRRHRHEPISPHFANSAGPGLLR